MDTITTAATTYTPPGTSVVHNAQVSLTDRSPASVVHVVQYDNTFPIVAVALTANGQPYTVPSGAAVNVRMKKPDGSYVYNPALGVSENAQTAYIAVTLQMTVFSGKISPIVEVVLNGAVAGTGFFTLDIDPNPIPEDAIESTDEYKTIQQLAAQAQAAADASAASQTAAAGSASAAAESASNASASETNAAESATNAANSASAAAASEGNAANSATSASGYASDAAQSASAAAGSATAAQEYAEQAQQVSQGAVGYYDTPEALRSAHPTGQAGNWAVVGSTDTIWVWDTDTNAWLDTSQNVNLSNYYTKAQADSRFSDAVAYTITVPTTGWTTGSLTWGGTTYTRKCTVTAADATASPTSVSMSYEGGDYDAYCQIGLIDTQDGSVVLWATQDPTAECQIRVVEVRSNAGT